MWKKIAPLLIVLSVALNVAFVGTWVLRASRSPATVGAPDGGNEAWCPLHRGLDVTDEQWEQIEPRLIEFRDRSQAIRVEMNRLRGEMIDLIAADQPDLAAIASKREDISSGQQRMQKLVIAHLLSEKEILNPEQQKVLFELLREQMACRGPVSMMGLSPESAAEPTP